MNTTTTENSTEVKVAEQNHILTDGWTHTIPQTEEDTKTDRKERERQKHFNLVMTFVRQRKWDKIDRTLLDKAGLQSIPKIVKIADNDLNKDLNKYVYKERKKKNKKKKSTNKVVRTAEDMAAISVIMETMRSAEAIRYEVKNKLMGRA